MSDPSQARPGVVLITGATGTLGVPTVQALRRAGHDVRPLSRRPGPGRAVGDLRTGAGLAAAHDGVDTVIHLATTATKDLTLTRSLLDEASRAGVGHLVYVSIVGVDQIPLPYYRTKLAAEHLVAGAGVPYTILRATQFHGLVAGLFAAQRLSPVVLAPGFPIQPIEVREVADRLVELVGDGAAGGRASDIGGPEQRTGVDLARAWQRATGSRRPVRSVRLPGRTFAAYAEGHHLVLGEPYGHGTFEDHLARAQVAGPLDG